MLKRRAIASILLMLGPTPLFAAAGFIKTGAMTFGRATFPAVVLPDGSVLMVSDSTVELYDPASGSFSLAGPMTTNRGGGLTATLLPNGTVLIVGGQFFDTSQESAEIYDPAAGTFTPTGSLSIPRSFHAATLLADGRVLITGGHQFNHPSSALDTGEVYDPDAGAFAPQGNMGVRRQDHTATLLADGRVLIAGGYDNFQSGLTSAELFDPATGSFTATGSLAAGRGNHSATRLPNGKVVVMGGHAGFPGGSLDSAEVYDPGAGSFAPAGTMTAPRGAHTATELPDGALLVVGGFTSFPFTGTTLASAEIYDPDSAGFAPSVSMHEARGRHVAALLPGGNVLVAGGIGQCCGGGLGTAEIFSASVVDTTPPVVTVPFDITVLQTSPQGAEVSFSVSAADDVDAAPIVTCEPPSGSIFSVGTTTVVCTATDNSGNQGTASFEVTVVEPLDIAITIDPTGLVDPRTGLATLSGTVSCNRVTQRGITVELTQGSGPGALQGSFSRGFTCVPPSLGWIASVSAGEGKFHPGEAQARVSGEFCDQFSCDSDSVVRSVRLTPRGAEGGAFPIAKIADRSMRMPGSNTEFGSFSVPFVKNGVVVFQGYGPTLAHSGLYSSTGGRLSVLADTRTPVPGGAGNFTGFDSPAFDGVTLAFQGHDASSGVGLYASRGGSLTRIADVQTPAPGGAGTFGGFVGPVVSGDRVAFRGSSELSAFGTFGIYAGDADALALVADRQTPFPGGVGNFAFFGARPVIDGETVAFPASGSGPGENGMFSSRDGVLTTIADTSTPVPGGSGNFLFFGTPAIDDGIVAFTGFDETFRPGIYTSAEGTLQKVVDTETVIPGQATTFGTFGSPVVEGGLVAFVGLTPSFTHAGLYAASGDSLITLADASTPVPGGQGVFNFFGTGPALSGGRVAFVGGDSTGTPGIYVRTNDTLHKVISATDTLEGKAIAFLQLATVDACDFFGCLVGFGSGFDGSRVAFHATFADSSQGIYLASVSTPLAALTARAEIDKDDFALQASFSLGHGHNGIDPTREGTTLRVGPYPAFR